MDPVVDCKYATLQSIIMWVYKWIFQGYILYYFKMYAKQCTSLCCYELHSWSPFIYQVLGIRLKSCNKIHTRTSSVHTRGCTSWTGGSWWEERKKQKKQTNNRNKKKNNQHHRFPLVPAHWHEIQLLSNERCKELLCNCVRGKGLYLAHVWKLIFPMLHQDGAAIIKIMTWPEPKAHYPLLCISQIYIESIQWAQISFLEKRFNTIWFLHLYLM